MNDKKLRVGVVGVRVGGGHIADYAASPSVSEIVICDIDEKELKAKGDKYGIQRRYTDVAEMLAKESLDAVSVALPNKLHMPMSIRALEAGCHVLCEKPMACTAGDAALMAEAARRTGRKLMINFNQRFVPIHQAMKALIDSGRLGEIYSVRTIWRRRRGVPRWYNLTKDSCGGGSLIDLGVHRLDLAMWLCGFPEPAWVLGNTFSRIEPQSVPRFELEDMAMAMIRMKNGAMFDVEATWASHCEGESLSTRIFGSKGGLLLSSGAEGSRNTFFSEMDGRLINVDFAEGEFGNAGLAPPTSIRQAFLDAILTDGEVPCTPAQGIAINRILDAVYRSAATGGPVAME